MVLEVLVIDHLLDLLDGLALYKRFEDITALVVAVASRKWTAAVITYIERLTAAGTGDLRNNIRDLFEQEAV